jgi:hypothetical protein
MCGCDVCPPEFLLEGAHRRADVLFTSLCVCQQLTDGLAMLLPAQVAAALHITRAFGLACCWVMTS